MATPKLRYIEIVTKEELKEARFKALNDTDLKVLAEPNIIKVVIYARYSSDMQREESIDAQIRYCKEEIERNPNMVLIGVYYDEALSGKFDDREDFQVMISDARAGKFDRIMVHKFSRFARNQYDSVIYKKVLRDIGIRVVSATQKVDDTPEGQMTEAIIEVLDQYYSANLAEEVLKGMRENALKGQSTGGRPPLGYQYDENGFLEINKETAPIARKIFDMYVEGYGMYAIANMMNEMGYRSQTGNEFRGSTIGDILANEKYIGTNVYTIRDEVIKRENNHPAIIDRATWDIVQSMRNEKTKPRLKGDALYALTGKVYCAECHGKYSGGGSKLVGSSKKGSKEGSRRNYYYTCNNKRHHGCTNGSVNKDKLERYLCTHIINELLSDDSIEQIANAFEIVVKEMMRESNEIPLEKLEKEQALLKKQIQKLLALYLDDEDDTFDKDDLKEQTAAKKKHLKAIEKQIQAAKTDFSKILKKEDAVKYLRYFKTSFDFSSKVMIKALLDTFIDKVIIHHDCINVTYKVDISNINVPTPSDVDISRAGYVGDTLRNGRARLILPPIKFRETIGRDVISAIDINDINLY